MHSPLEPAPAVDYDASGDISICPVCPMNLFDKLQMQLRFRRFRRRKEAAEIRFMQSLPLSGRTVIDIGANKGVYSYWLSHAVGVQGRVIAFEPQPELEKHLQEVILGFSLSNVELMSCALSSQAGKASLYRRQEGAGDASFEAMPGGEAVTVSCTTLDDYVTDSGLDDLAYIKCDVEGHELAVLEGAEQALKRWMPVLQVECHHREAAQGGLFAYLSGLGYDGFFIWHGRRIPCTEFARHPCRKATTDYRNYLFVPARGQAGETNPDG